MGKPACQHLFHGRVIVGSLDGLYFKFPVIVPLRTSVLEDYHGTNGLETADIGDIVRLDAVDRRQVQPSGDLFYGTDRPTLFPLDPLAVLVENDLCVPLCQFHHFFLAALFRHADADLLAPFAA